MEFKGVYTALITPFSNGEGDYGKLRELVNRQIDGGVAGIVPVGTTGESPTLTYEEHLKVIEETIKTADGRCQIIAGTGANSTHEAVEMTLKAKAMGADASLQVTPYYNKPTQEGLYRHFMTVAEATELPVVLYNVPGRSGIPINIDTIIRLRQANPLIAAVKEAIAYYDATREHKRNALPYMPKGFTKWGGKEACFGLRCGEKVLLYLWNLGMRGVHRIPLPASATVKAGYPKRARCCWEQAEDELRVTFDSAWDACILEITLAR